MTAANPISPRPHITEYALDQIVGPTTESPNTDSPTPMAQPLSQATSLRVDAAMKEIKDELANTETAVTENTIGPEVLEKLEQLKHSADEIKKTLQSINRSGRNETRLPANTDAVNSEIDPEVDTGAANNNTRPSNRDEDAISVADDILDLEFSNLRGKSMVDTVFDFALQVFKQPDVFVQRYTQFAKELVNIVQTKSELQPQRGDRRFRDAVWQDNRIYRIVLQSYLAWSKELQGLVDDLAFDDEADQRRAQFLLNQLSAALAPSNSPLNPTAVKRAYQTGGQSVVMGMQNLLRDIKSNGGMPRQVSNDVYKVGTDLGNSPGAVIYRSRVFEIIQYGCSEQDKVFQRPVVIVPPQINKFYIFDLTPKNSLVKHLLDNGQQVFIVSWKNPNQQHAKWGMDTYVSELDKGLKAVLDITASKDLNLVSACAGGITSMALQAYHASKGDKIIRNHSVLVTAFSAEGHPTLDLFLNKQSVEHALSRTQSKGVMEGKELAHVFAWLRPTDLVWNYWVNNNLLGKEPPTMDVLFWDNDSTRLPAALHKDFIDILLNKRFAESKKSKKSASEGHCFHINGQALDLSKIRGDFYFLAGDEDYLMPWKNCYKNLSLLPKTKCEFVLSDSGHIQSVLRPPGIGNTHYYTHSDYTLSPEAWLESAENHKGSWWTHWLNWLEPRSGRRKNPPSEYGNHNYPPICESPGVYVSEK